MAWIGAKLTVATLAFALVAHAAGTPTPEGLEFFETKIRPVLAKNCYACHSAEAKTRMGGLSLDTRDGIREGGQRGHAVVPLDLESSLIVEALRYDGELRMPPSGKLPDEVVQDFAQWIEMGAPDPRQIKVQAIASNIDLEKGRQYWAFRAPSAAAPPAVRAHAWPRGILDQYVLAGLESNGLRPVPDAGKADLLRRVTFDLTGLPPTPQALEDFLSDESEGAYKKVVDRHLKSDRFGERWGRHWLDVVRYADTVGRTRNLPFPVAWKYRNYVIRSFNDDKPYDTFIRQQIAGDLLPYSSAEERIANQIATGFLAIGAHDLNEPDAKQFDMDVADEMINVSTRSILALSVGCARCHDHKFDPIPTEDYYALAGIFRSSEVRSGLRRRPRFNAGYFRAANLVGLDGVPEFSIENAAEVRAQRNRLWEELQAAEKARDRKKCRELSRALGKLPLPENLAMGVVEAAKTVPMRVNVGGDPHTLGEPVRRGFVQVLLPADVSLPRIGRRESGRLQLADWLTRRDNPLTARVMVNRVWHHLFGKGIVATVDNFGAMGRPPTNPGLLDHLARQFMKQDWSVKSLIREIVLSRTYRLSTDFDEANFEVDPDNDHLWRANLRRLEAEAVRDAVLLVSGELQTGPPPPSPVHGFDRNQLINSRNRQLKPWELREDYRSVYVPVIRNQANRFFEAFDFPEPSETHGARDVTTGPGQALFMMNSDFVRSHASIAAGRLLARPFNNRERVRYLFRQVLSRDPTKVESARAMRRIRKITDSIGLEHQYESDRSAAKAWLSGMLSAVLDRHIEDDEITDAMNYFTSLRPGADRSAAAASAAMTEGDGSFRRDLVQGMIEAVIGPRLSRKDRVKAGKNLSRWQNRERKRSLDGYPGLLALSASPEQEAWTRLYQALYNSAEFRYRN